MEKQSFSKLTAITPDTLIVGVDIAKNTHWARFTDYWGIPLGKALTRFIRDGRLYQLYLPRMS